MIKNTKSILPVLGIALILSLTFVLANALVSPSTFSVNQSVMKFYNLTVNNSEAASVNFTEVNITLPAGFFYVSTSAGTTAAAAVSFFNTTVGATTRLRWNHTGFVVQNVTNQSFWFNATANATTTGTQHFNVSLVNVTGVTYYDIVVTVNDTIVPATVNFASPTQVNNSNFSISSVAINATIYDNSFGSSGVVSANFSLYNSTHSKVNESTDGTAPYTANFTGHSDGVYFYNVSVNDSTGNYNYSVARRIVIDTVAPVIALTQDTASSETSIVGTIAITEATSGINVCSPSLGTITAGAGTNTQTFTLANLDCGENKTFTLTCTDHANNTVVGSINLGTDACTSAGGRSSGGGSSISAVATTWKVTYADDATFTSLGKVIRQLAANERASFKVGNVKHHVGVKSTTATSATIEVASTPQTATMQIGETRKFDVNADGFYDISVTLNSVTNGKADITILSINEAVPAATQNTTSSATNTQTESTTTGTTGTQETSSTDEETQSKSSKAWIWILVVLVVIAAIWFFMSRNKR